MIKLLELWNRRGDMTHDQAVAHWHDVTAEDLKRRIAQAAPILWPDERAFIGTYRAMLVEERRER